MLTPSTLRCGESWGFYNSVAKYTAEEVAIIRECGRLLAHILRDVIAEVRPGVQTSTLDAMAREGMQAAGGVPSFLGYTAGGAVPFPSALCVSINNEVVHGPALPSRELHDGDIVGLDIGMRYPAKDGFCTDMAMTVPVGQLKEADRQLLEVTREALQLGVAAALPGATVGDISRAIEKRVKAAGYGIVRELVGHGVGRQVHEAPEVPNFFVRGPIAAAVLQPGLVIAIEPMVNAGGASIRTLADNWTIATRDGSRAAHFEQTIVISEHGPAEIVTPFL